MTTPTGTASTPSRRNVMAASLAMPFAASLAGPFAASLGVPFATVANAADAPELDRLEALVKMRGSTDKRVGFAWIKGIRFAQVDGVLHPMCGMLNCTINRYERLDDETFDLRLYELSFYTNVETGTYQPKLEMPVTGRVVDVPLYRTGPGQHIVKTANKEEMSWSKDNTTSEEAAGALAPDGKILYEVELSQPTISGDHLWLTTEATTHLIPNDPADTPWFYKEMITNHASLKAIQDPDTTHVDSAANYTLMMGWRPWMQMDDIEGNTMTHAIGGRVWSLDELPADIASHIREYHPDVAADPGSWLGV